MIKFLFTVFIISLSINSNAQDLFIPGNPYDNAPETASKRNSFNRERWFYEQRMYPNNKLPDDAYSNSLKQRDLLRQTDGYLLDGRNTWTNIGPTSGYYFTYGNISSRITTVKYDPVNPSTIYLGAAFGGVWKSTDGGTTWIPKMQDEVSLSSGALAIDPNNTNIIYYGTGEATYSGASYYGRGLLKSTNGGDSWINYPIGSVSLTYVSRIVIRPGAGNELLAALGSRSSLGVSGGLFRSTDAGVTWNLLVSGRCDDVVFSPDGSRAYAIGSGTGYRVSTDGGATFTLNTNVFPTTRNHIAVSKSSPNILFAATHTGSTISVFKSTDSGENFSPSASGTNFSGSQAWYDFYMYINPFDPEYAYVGSIDIWRTTNGGTSFQNITNGYAGGNVHVDQQNLEFHPTNSNELLSVNDGGIWKSNDRGATWTNLNTTLTLTQFYRIASDPSNAAHILGGTQDNGTQRTLGTQNWVAAFGGDGGEVCFHLTNPQYILGETQNNGVRRSQDGGENWSTATSGLTGSGSWVAPLISHPDSAGIFYTARQTVFKTTNWGASWFSISTGTSGTIREMGLCKNSPETMFATSGSQVFKSTNRGYTYTNVSNGLPNKTITGIYLHPDSSDVVLVSLSGFGNGYIYRSSNGGTTWNNISSNLPDSPANDLLIYYPGTATSIYLLANDVGVFISNNYGISWTELAAGLPNTVAMHLDYNEASNKLRIGTHGRGVYEITGLTGIASIGSEIPSDFSLEQNYPNPFNPTTTIRYNIPVKGNVTLKLYNTLGKEVESIVSQIQSPGNYSITLNAGSLTSGVYYYKLNVNSEISEMNFTDTKKMILLK